MTNNTNRINEKMKKIAFIIHRINDIGGEQRLLSVMANSLVSEYDIIIYSNTRINRPYFYELDERINVKSIGHITELGGIFRRAIRKAIRLIFKRPNEIYSNFVKKAVYKTILKSSPDYVIAMGGPCTVLIGSHYFKENKHIKTIAWELSSYEAYFETEKKYLWGHDKEFQEALSFYDRCVVLNEYVRGKYKEKFGFNCDVIYNPRGFVSVEKSPLTNKQFISCGRLIEGKGFDLLIESFKIFSENDDEWKLIIIGEGPKRKEIESKIKEYRLHERVKLLGTQTDVKKYMLNSSVFLLCSMWEGFPMCITEAYECGLPVISFDITAMIPLKDNNECLLAKSFDTQSFAKKMLLLGHDFELRRQMGKNASLTAEKLSVECIMEKWKTIL